MLSPTPFSLLCAILLCLPLAVIYIILTPTTITTTAAASSVRGRTTTTNRAIISRAVPTLKTKTQNKTAATTPSPSEMAVGNPGQLLLRTASKANPNFTRPKKLAFMFLTTTPLLFAPLWEVYFNQTPKALYNIYIHSDPKISTHNFTGIFLNRVIPDSKPTRRYSHTLISAARRLLAYALLHDKGNYMFALVSPSCIPLHSFNFTYRTLTRSRKSFIEILKNEPGAYNRWAARGDHVMEPEVPFEKFRIGSQFFVMTRRHARVVVRDTLIWSKFKLECVSKYNCYPEENYFATLMNMVDPRGCVPATLTHVDWKGRHDGHPHTYLKDEVGSELILAIRKHRPRYGNEGFNGSDRSVTKQRHDPFLFARKFSPDSIQPLMKITKDVIFKD